MDNIYYIHDAGTGALFVIDTTGAHDIELHLGHIANENGMHWRNCSWGAISSISIDI